MRIIKFIKALFKDIFSKINVEEISANIFAVILALTSLVGVLFLAGWLVNCGVYLIVHRWTIPYEHFVPVGAILFPCLMLIKLIIIDGIIALIKYLKNIWKTTK